MEVIIQFALLAVGFLLLIKGADWFVGGASKIADRFGIPQLIIGLTIVAMGTSAPEAAVSISAAVKNSDGYRKYSRKQYFERFAYSWHNCGNCYYSGTIVYDKI